jgi:hypothetical protein
MNLIAVVGTIIAIISIVVAVTRAGGDIRWGIASGVIISMIVMAGLAWAHATGLA